MCDDMLDEFSGMLCLEWLFNEVMYKRLVFVVE